MQMTYKERAARDVNRHLVLIELKKTCIKHISFEVFKKTTEEKNQLKEAKKKHFKMLRNAGFTKKRMNLSEPIIAWL